MGSGARVRRAVLALLIIGAALHLDGLSHPRQVVFDEVHWGKSVSAYCCTGQRQFDVHPPHGKLLLTLGAWLGGYDGTLSFETIGQTYDGQPVFWFRLIPALSGVLIPVLFFFFLRGVGGSVATAWLGGLLLALDNAYVLETRTMLFDGILVASSLAALVCLLAIDHAATPRRAWAWTIGCGALAGLAVGTKFTGLAVPVIIAAFLWWAWRTRSAAAGVLARRALAIAASGAAVYVAGWMVHFALLTQPGPADAYHTTTGRIVEDLVAVHRAMFAANIGMIATHPDASTPLSWLVMKVPPFFWAGDGAAEYLVGNPVVWWGSSLMLVVIVVNTGLMRVTRLRLDARRKGSLFWWLLLAYGIAYLPFFQVTRVLFLYHYLTPLVFSLACVLIWLEEAGWIRSEPAGGQRASYYGVMVAAVLGFLLMSPLTYGYRAGAYGEWLVSAIRSWR